MQAGSAKLQCRLILPEDAYGVVVHVEESCSTGFRLCHQTVTNTLTEVGIAALLIDLLTPDEEANPRAAANRRKDVELLASRIVAATDWLSNAQGTHQLALGYFATGVGAAAVLAAAAVRPATVSAIVSCCGRPLLARPALPQVRAPTLLITFDDDDALVRLNRAAFSQLPCEKRLDVVASSHDRPDTPDTVGRLTRDWFEHHLV